MIANLTKQTTPVYQQRTLSYDQLKKLFEPLSLFVFAIDLDGSFVHVGQNSEQFFGYTSFELTENQLLHIVHKNDHKKVSAYLEKLVQGKAVNNFECWLQRKDRSLFQASWALKWDAADQLFYGTIQDITEQKAKESLLEAQKQSVEEKSHQVYEMMERITDCFYALDNEWRIIYINTQLEKILNIRRENYLGSNLWESFPELIGSELDRQLNKAMKEKVPVQFTSYLEAFKSWYEVHVYPSITGLSVFFQDITEKKKTEEELKSANERFRLAAKSSAIYDWNLVTNKVQWGEGLFDLLGYEPRELEFEGLPGLLHPEERESVVEDLYATINNTAATTRMAEYRALKKDNTYCYVQVISNIIRDEEGKAVRSVGIFQDASERKKAEAERKEFEIKVQKQNEKLVDILERMNQGFFTLDNEFKVTYWNKSAEEIIGVPRENILGQNIINFYDDEAKHVYYPMFEKVLHDHQPYHSEFICPQNGRWTEINIYPSAEGLTVFFKDIDQRKRTEEELQKLSIIAQQTNNIVMITGADGKITWVNDAFTKISGYTLSEAFGLYPGEFLRGPESDPNVTAYIDSRIAKAEPFTIETLNYTKNKEKFWVEMHCQPVKDEYGKAVQYFSIQTDITERKKLEAELQAQQKRTTAAVIDAQEKERALVGQELHDNVNQVLTTVKLYTELCRDGIGNTQEIQDKSIKLLQDSINEIRSLSKRLSAPSLGNIRLKDSIKELVDAVAATGKIALHLDVSGIDHLELAHEVHLGLYRILQEHLTNILKHAAANEVHILLCIMNGKLVLRVADDGKGFDTQQYRKGIGIANMTTRAEALKGTLSIDSAPGAGCRLVVHLPWEHEHKS
jgi:PAS domain S-box-containing protein